MAIKKKNKNLLPLLGLGLAAGVGVFALTRSSKAATSPGGTAPPGGATPVAPGGQPLVPFSLPVAPPVPGYGTPGDGDVNDLSPAAMRDSVIAMLENPNPDPAALLQAAQIMDQHGMPKVAGRLRVRAQGAAQPMYGPSAPAYGPMPVNPPIAPMAPINASDFQLAPAAAPAPTSTNPFAAFTRTRTPGGLISSPIVAMPPPDTTFISPTPGGGLAVSLVPAFANVLEIQQELAAEQYGIAADGIPGPRSYAATVAFQTAHGLTPDGLVGQATRAALQTEFRRRTGATAPSVPLSTVVNMGASGAAGVVLPAEPVYFAPTAPVNPAYAQQAAQAVSYAKAAQAWGGGATATSSGGLDRTARIFIGAAARTHQVRRNETARSVAAARTGDPNRFNELLAANPGLLKRVPIRGTRDSYVAPWHEGLVLALPASWS